MKPTVEELVNALPPEDRMRLLKKAKSQKKTVREMVISILTKGASTRTAISISLSVATNFILK